MTIDDLISLTDGRDDKVYFYIEIQKLDGRFELFQDRIVHFPYDGESVEILNVNFSGYSGKNGYGRPYCSTVNCISVKQITNEPYDMNHMTLSNGGWVNESN